MKLGHYMKVSGSLEFDSRPPLTFRTPCAGTATNHVYGPGSCRHRGLVRASQVRVAPRLGASVSQTDLDLVQTVSGSGCSTTSQTVSPWLHLSFLTSKRTDEASCFRSRSVHAEISCVSSKPHCRDPTASDPAAILCQKTSGARLPRRSATRRVRLSIADSSIAGALSTDALVIDTVIWGLIGPGRQFSPGRLYAPCMLGFLAGAVAPIPFYILARRQPAKWYKFFNAPMIFSATAVSGDERLFVLAADAESLPLALCSSCRPTRRSTSRASAILTLSLSMVRALRRGRSRCVGCNGP
jgi:hypothetical protein